MFVNVFLILCAYYFVKPLREGWIAISDVSGLSKMEVKAYSSFGQSLLLVPVVSWYGQLAQRLPRAALIARASLFCISNMVVFWALQPGVFFDSLPVSGIVFYLWVGMFGVFVVAHFWAFAADVYEDGPGRRILPVIAIGATAGAARGGRGGGGGRRGRPGGRAGRSGRCGGPLRDRARAQKSLPRGRRWGHTVAELGEHERREPALPGGA